MERATMSAAIPGPQVGDLIPDFSGRTADGRTIYRRDFKGRRHLVLCFVAPLPPDAQRQLAAALAVRYADLRAAGAEIVAFAPAHPSDVPTAPYPSLADPTGETHARFGAATVPTLLVADRYGEIVVRRALAADPAAALDEALAAAEWLQTRCSL